MLIGKLNESEIPNGRKYNILYTSSLNRKIEIYIMKMLIHIRIVQQDDWIGQKLSIVPQSVRDTDRKTKRRGPKENYRTSLATDCNVGTAQSELADLD
jgi:hypothetical protein